MLRLDRRPARPFRCKFLVELAEQRAGFRQRRAGNDGAAFPHRLLGRVVAGQDRVGDLTIGDLPEFRLGRPHPFVAEGLEDGLGGVRQVRGQQGSVLDRKSVV